MELEIQIVQPGNTQELKELISVFEIVFEMETPVRASESHLKMLLGKENFFAVVAKLENKIIAGLTFYVLDQYYSEKPLAYIYDLAVLEQFQRKGIGRKLVEFTKLFCKEKGFEEMFVQADKVDELALEFYRSTQPTNEEDVIHFSYRLY